jgi:GTP-binding protein
MSRKIPVVAIIGRTNVGKSTLFNALAKRRIAIVEDSPGVTRDRNYTLIKTYGAPFGLIDTGGLVGEDEEQVKGMSQLVRAQADMAIQDCDLVLVVFDGLHGPHALDHEVVDHIRRSGKPVLWVVYKCEQPLNEVLSAEFYTLGLDELHCVSAAHRDGLQDLGNAISAKLGISGLKPSTEEDEKHIRIAVVGRPNVGKSSLVNKILGEDRLIAADAPGTTRDCIDIELIREGRHFTLVDTAGLRKKAKVESGTLERFSNLRSLKALVGCDVAVLVLDATEGLPSDQDKKIAELIHERGRGFILVVNKWDLVEKDHRTVKQFEEAIFRELPFARYAPMLFVSALTGRRCPNVLREAAKIYDGAREKISTGALNKLLERIFQINPPPVVRGQPVRLYFATQISVAPPTILMFLNYPENLPQSYLRYVKTHLRKVHPMEGVDIKFELRKRTDKQQRKIESSGDERIEPTAADVAVAESLEVEHAAHEQEELTE